MICAMRSGRIASAWLADPTTRYDHGVLGDQIEAAALRLRTRDGKVLTYRLPGDSVFEDLEPRIVALDDGAAVIAWLAAQPWCSGAVGMTGISWGGFNALQVAARAHVVDRGATRLDLGPRCLEIGARGVDLGLEPVGAERHQQVAGGHRLVGGDMNLFDIAVDARADHRDVAAHIGVIGGN